MSAASKTKQREKSREKRRGGASTSALEAREKRRKGGRESNQKRSKSTGRTGNTTAAAPVCPRPCVTLRNFGMQITGRSNQRSRPGQERLGG